MPNSAIAEVYFIAIMMFLIIILCVAATYIFFRQYNREMKAREEAKLQRAKEKAKALEQQSETK